MIRAFRLLLLMAAVAAFPTESMAREDWRDALIDPVSRLWVPLADGARVAVRPLDPDESGLPDDLLREVEDSLTAALLATAPPTSEVVSRRDLPAAWEEAGTFVARDTTDMLTEAAVDALVVPRLTGRRDGVELSAVLLGVGHDAAGDVLAVMPSTDLPVDVSNAGLAGAEAGARRLGVALAEGLRLSLDPSDAFAVRVERRGRRSPAADWFAGLVEEHLVRRLATPPLYVSRPLRDLGKAPAGGRVLLDLDLWDQKRRVDVQARAVMGTAEARGTVHIDPASIPAAFLPLTRDGGRVGAGLYRAAGSFAPTTRTDPREIRFAARVLARAALVDDALGNGTGRADGRGVRDVSEAMRRLSRGVPHEEVWQGKAGDGSQSLSARLARVGGASAPRLDAAVERALYRAGEVLSARALVQDGRAYVAAYAWQADDTVVRIAPRDRAARAVEAGVRLSLPGHGDAEVTAAPLAGSDETVEAVLVVASAVPFDAGKLAPAVGRTASESLGAAAQMSAFLDALAALDLGRISLAVLPYRVRGAD